LSRCPDSILEEWLESTVCLEGREEAILLLRLLLVLEGRERPLGCRRMLAALSGGLLDVDRDSELHPPV